MLCLCSSCLGWTDSSIFGMTLPTGSTFGMAALQARLPTIQRRCKFCVEVGRHSKPPEEVNAALCRPVTRLMFHFRFGKILAVRNV